MVTLQDVEKAARILRGKIYRTPLVYSASLSQEIGGEVYLKLENLQRTGSFKLRGATHKIQIHREHLQRHGIVAASAGNHAQGVALAARHAGIAATIVMPEDASISKQQAAEAYGGRIVLKGRTLTESLEEAARMAEGGMTLIHPFDDPEIIAGQGTVALEIFEDLPDPDFLLVPIGGGGLISGVAVAAKAIRPQAKVIGVQAAASPSAYASRRAGRALTVECRKTIADGIAVKQPGTITFPIIQEKVEEVILVEEDQIAVAVLTLLERKKILAEGAGAVSVGPLLAGSLKPPKGAKVVCVISGGNVDTPLLDRILRQALMQKGRMVRFSVYLDDAPGALARVLARVGELRANVLHIHHHRSEKGLPITTSRVTLELETRDLSHGEEIKEQLTSAGYALAPA